MIYALLGVAAIALGFAGTATALGIRIGGLKAELGEAISRAHDLEAELQSIMREYAAGRAAHAKQLAVLRADLESLEADLAQCNTPGSIRQRISQAVAKAASRSIKPAGDA